MNTLRILKGKDISISVDDTQLFFVTDFCAHESCDEYKIEEILGDSEVDGIMLKKNYILTLTALTHLNHTVFEKDSFTLKVDDGERIYMYTDCKLKERKREINASKPVVDKYTIVASQMNVSEGYDE